MRALKLGFVGGVLALCAVASAQAAVLTPVTVDCFLGFVNSGSPITGNVGDTVVISSNIQTCTGVAATPSNITGSATIANGTPQTYTLVAAGAGNISLTPQLGGPFNIPFTVNAAQVAAVPTLSEYGLIALASLMAMVGIWTMRKRGSI
jgi:hypothetical protein